MVNGPNQVPLVASCLLDICLKSLSPSVTNHWLTAAFARDKCQTVQKIRDHFFFSDVTAGTARFRALARVSTALSSFAIAAGFPEVAEAHWSRLLLYRLENGPDLSWEPIELGLTTSLRSSGLTPRNHADFLAIVRALHAEDWADEGNSLRVRPLPHVPHIDTYLCAHNRHFAKHTSHFLYHPWIGRLFVMPVVCSIRRRYKRHTGPFSMLWSPASKLSNTQTQWRSRLHRGGLRHIKP